MIHDFSIIGAGVAGMTAALTLAKSSRSVALIESSEKIGPLLRGFKRKGIFFDTGFHYAGGLGDGEILDIFFKYLGLSGHIRKEPFDPNGFDLIRFPDIGFEFPFPYKYDRIQERLSETFPGDEQAIIRYLHAVEESCLSRPYLNLNARVVPLQEMRSVHGPSLNEFLDGLTPNLLLKKILSTHCFLHGSTSSETTFFNHSAVVGPYYSSVHGIEGGGRSLVKAFDAEMKKAGVDIFCGNPVSQIQFSPDLDLKEIHIADGRIVTCRSCICTIHPQNMLKLIPQSLFRPAYINRLKRLEETFSAHILYGKCSHPIETLTNRNIFVYPRLDEPGFRADCSIDNRPIFITGVKPDHWNHNGHAFIAICPATIDETAKWSDTHTGHRPSEYSDFKERIMEDFKTHIEKNCPELKGKITPIELSTPLTLRDFTQSPFGSMYGVKHRIGQYNPMPVTRLNGLYLAGQAVVAPGVLGALISGLVACGNIIGHDRLRKEIIQCQ